MINKLQGSVGTHLRHDGIFSEHFTVKFLLSRRVKGFKIGEHISTLHARMGIVSRTLCVGAPSADRRRIRQTSWVWWTTAVVNCCYIDFDLVYTIIKLVQTDFNVPKIWRHQWIIERWWLCAKGFCSDLCCGRCGHSVDCSVGTLSIYLFISELHNAHITSTFQQLFWTAESSSNF